MSSRNVVRAEAEPKGAAPAPQGDFTAEARRIAAEFNTPSPVVYWSDLLLTLGVLAVSLGAAVLAPGAWKLAGGGVAALALYRAISFIHELTHLRPDELPGFKFAWNALVGVPFLVPSFLYEGVHNIHHVQQRYGTPEDPEYLPLARGRIRGLVGFVAVGLLAPLGAYLRFAVGTPLSYAIPGLRPAVFARYSAMVINPAFRRRDLGSAATAAWRAQEIACWLWSWTLTALVVQGGTPARAVLTGAAVMSLATLVNQLRTLVAHAWEGDGRPMTLADQYRDTVNVPPPGLLPFLWAPVGLRYHALHHLVPRAPYHSLGEVHRRLKAALPAGSDYDVAERRGLVPAVAALARATRRAQTGR